MRARCRLACNNSVQGATFHASCPGITKFKGWSRKTASWARHARIDLQDLLLGLDVWDLMCRTPRLFDVQDSHMVASQTRLLKSLGETLGGAQTFISSAQDGWTCLLPK
eukprot:scaffold82158_cov21-Tisochrysis_lutea.AAC.1